jgi:hypothetical protein
MQNLITPNGSKTGGEALSHRNFGRTSVKSLASTISAKRL